MHGEMYTINSHEIYFSLWPSQHICMFAAGIQKLMKILLSYFRILFPNMLDHRTLIFLVKILKIDKMTRESISLCLDTQSEKLH